MASLNQVTLVGNVTRNVELRQVGKGFTVTDLGLALNSKVKKGEEWVDETVFVDVTLWGRVAETASEKLSKGSSVLIEGRLKFDSWEQDGQKRTKLGIVGDRLQILGAPKQQGSAPVRVTPSRQTNAHEMPF
jgi:single-strand DNA-binding protein